MFASSDGTRRSRLTVASLSTLISLLVISVANATPLLTGASPPSDAAQTVWDAVDVRVNDPRHQFEGDVKSMHEPVIAINPKKPSNLLAFAMDVSCVNKHQPIPGYCETLRGFRSTDGGRTWKHGGIPRYPGDKFWLSGDPVVTFDADGTAYLASLGRYVDEEGGLHGGIWIHRSRNGGASWQRPVVAAADTRDQTSDTCTSSDKEWLSVDPRTGKLYLAYTRIVFQCSAIGDPIGAEEFIRFKDMGIHLTSSSDGGKTWEPPRQLWRGYALGAIPQVGPDGTLYVSFWSSVPEPLGVCPNQGVALASAGGHAFAATIVGSSDDDGETWRFHQVGSCRVIARVLWDMGKPSFQGGDWLPTFSVDQSSGVAYVAWPTYSPVENRFVVQLIVSRDGGEMWSEPVDLPTGDNDARMTSLIADNGALRLVYVTTDAEGKGSVLMIESVDGGGNWSEPVPISTEISDFANQNWNDRAGDYIGFDIAGGRVAAIWTDARNRSPVEIWARTGAVMSGSGAASMPRRSVAAAEARITGGILMSGLFASSEAGSSSLVAGVPSLTLMQGVASRGARGAPANCGDTPVANLPLRIPPGWSARFGVPCSIDQALPYYEQWITQKGYQVVFSENEGFEGEIFAARLGRAVLIKVVFHPTRADASRVIIQSMN